MINSPLRFAVVWVAVLVGSTTAQSTTWVRRMPGKSPPRLNNASIAYDASRRRVVLFGGSTGQATSQTWEWDGTTWMLRRTGVHPPARSNAAMVYDPLRREVVLFGGEGKPPNSRLGDTWTWNGTTWRKRSVAGPRARSGHRMAFDRTNGVVVLFGGMFNPKMVFSDTWTWNGTEWKRHNVSGPPLRFNHAMAWDGRQVVMFGGEGGPPTNKHLDTWTWNGTSWTRRGRGPSPRYAHAMAYDPWRGVVVLFGGKWNGKVYLGDTWEWTCGSWRPISVRTPGAREGAAMVFDGDRGAELSGRGSMLLFGGQNGTPPLNDTWVYHPGPKLAAGYTFFGKGCAGSGTPPRFGVDGVPRFDTSFSLVMSNVTPLSPAALIWGKKLDPPVKLPFPPGCMLLVNTSIVRGDVTTASGVLRVTVGRVPSCLRLAGKRFCNQFVVVPSLKKLEVHTTRGGCGTVGY